MKINDFQFNLTSRLQGVKFFLARGKGHFFRYLINRIKWHYFPKFYITPSFPDHVDIEITNNCNMACPMCYNRILKVKRGFMDIKLFKKIIDECANLGVFSIRLSWRGETLIHPKVIEMVRYAKQKGIKEVSFLTNGLCLDEKMSRKLVSAELDWLTVSFDGLGKIYEKIRKPAKFKETINKLKKLQQIKKALNRKKPVLKVQTIWTAIKNNPEEYYKTFENIADQITANPTEDYFDVSQIDHDPNYVCPSPWQRLVITCTGKAVQCIDDLREEVVLGNLKKQSIKEIWNGKKLNIIRHLQKNKQRLELPPCQKCYSGAKKIESNVKIGKRKVKAGLLK